MMLTAKQEKFALEFTRTGVASAAYEAAYSVGARTNRKTVWEMASRVLNNRKVAARIAEIRSAAARDASTTLGHLVLEFSHNRMHALDAGKIGLAQAASVAKAKALGYL